MSKSKKIDKKTNKLIYIVLFIIVALLIICGILKLILSLNSDGSVKNVKKILSAKYSSLECIDSYCNGIIAIKGDKSKEYTAELLNSDGKLIAKYKEKYDSDSKTISSIYEISDKYFIVKKINTDKDEEQYVINNKNGKELYSSKNKLNVLNNNYIIMEEDNDSEKIYSIINKKGKKIYSNIKEINTFDNGNIISVLADNKSFILDENLKNILNDYTVSKSIVNEDRSNDYLIVKNVKTNLYNYFDVSKQKIIGDEFISYKSVKDEIVVTKKKNNKLEKYVLKENGKQKKIKSEATLLEISKSVNKKIDNDKYYVYSSSLYKPDQTDVLVDNIETKEFGILNLDTKKFVSLYSYKADNKYFYSNVEKLNNDDDNLYLQMSCSSNYCDNSITIIYDFKNMKQLFDTKINNLLMDRYIHYDDDYKVIKYPKNNQNSEYAGKYVLYDKENKELLVKDDEIVVADKKVKFGETINDNVYVYSVKDSKLLSKNKFEKITISNNVFYRLEKNGRYEMYDDNLKKIISTKNSKLHSYDNLGIAYLSDEKIDIYNIKDSKVKSYKLKENESISNSDGEMIPLYKGSVIINNNVANYIKVINLNGKVVKKINNSQVERVVFNPKNKAIYIIEKKKNKYGLYIAK